MPASQYERILGAEWLVVMGVETADALTGADTGNFSLPDPSRYFATMIVYVMLAGASMFGQKMGKLAATFGGIAALAILIAPTKKTGKPLVNSLLVYFNQVITGGTQVPGSIQNPAAATGNVDQFTQTPSGAPNATTIPTLGTNPTNASIGGYNAAGYPTG